MEHYWKGILSASKKDQTITYKPCNITLPEGDDLSLLKGQDKYLVSVKKPSIHPIPKEVGDRKYYIRGVIDVSGRIVDPAQSDIMKGQPKFGMAISKETYADIKKFITVPHDYEMGRLEVLGCNILDFLSVYYENSDDIPLSEMRIAYEILKRFKAVSNLTLSVKKLDPSAVLPSKEHFSDTAFDLTLLSLKKEVANVQYYSTGLSIQCPFGYHVELAPRSSLQKLGYTIANPIPIIDIGYRGEILVLLTKTREDAKPLELPGRYVQLLLRETHYPSIREVDEFYHTNRSTGGIGSTGTKPQN